MKKLGSILMGFILTVAVFLAMPVRAEAENITSDVLGYSENIQWTYNEDTKTLTLTGDDNCNWLTGNYNSDSILTTICPDVEKVIVKDFVMYGCDGMFAGLDKMQSVTFTNVDTTELRGMTAMFNRCSSLVSVDMSSFDTSDVTGFSLMFQDCSSLTTVDMSSFDMTANQFDIEGIFMECDSLQTVKAPKAMKAGECIFLPGFFVDVQRKGTVSISSGFCARTLSKTEQIPDFTTWGDNGNIRLTYDEKTKTLTVTGEDTGTFAYRFSYYNSGSIFNLLSEDIENVIVKDCTIYDGMKMFAYMENLKNITFENFDTSNVTNMEGMFQGCINLQDIDVSTFDTSKVTRMEVMFQGCEKLSELDLRAFDTSNVQNMSYMFGGCTELRILDMSSFDLSNISFSSGMLDICEALVQIKTPKVLLNGYSIDLPVAFVDVNGNEITKITSENCNETITAKNCGVLGEHGRICWYYYKPTKTLVVTGEDTGTLGSWPEGSVFIKICPDVEHVILRDCKVYDCSNMFLWLSKLKSVTFNNFDTSEVESFLCMFQGCFDLVKINLEALDTSSATDTSYMFFDCSSLTNLDFSNFDTSGVKDMQFMFCGCESFTTMDVSNFDTANVEFMHGMFQACSGIKTLDLSNFNTSNTISMDVMFTNCSSLESIDLSSFDTAKVQYMDAMFLGCDKISALDLGSFDTSNVLSMEYMFKDCGNLEKLDISSFDFGKVSSKESMFEGCVNLEELDLSKVDLSNTQYDVHGLVEECTGLKTIHTPKAMAEYQDIALPGTFVDEKGNKTTKITKEFAGKTLKKEVCVSGITLNTDKVSVEKGDYYQLQATVAPDNATNKAVTWKSSDEAVTTVDANGKVTAVASGSATITATAADGSGISASCEVTVTDPVKFADVPESEWYYPYVKKAYDNGYMNGTGTDDEGRIIFNPLVNIPREQFVTVLFALEGVKSDSIQYTDRFSDVKESDWFAKPVEWAAQNGIVSGIGDGEFGVGQKITREQMALMLFKYAGYKGYDITVITDIGSFPDVNDVSSWAMEAMRWAIQNGVMSGQQMEDGIYLKPKDNAIRAVCATMIVAFAEKYDQK